MDESGAVREEELLRQIESTFPTLDRWQSELERAWEPAVRSELATDDADWIYSPLSQLARAALASARDHLHAVRVLIEARQFFPFAQSTLIRTSLVGAAQAVWLLAPDDPHQRLVRARKLAHETYIQHDKFISQALDLPPENLLPQATRTAEHVRQRRNEMATKRRENGDASTLNITEVVRLAAEAAFLPENPTWVIQALLIWRSASGAAHALHWPLFGQADTRIAGEPDDHGMAWHVAGGGIQRFANDYMCAFVLAQRGWALMATRSALNAADA